MMMENMTVSSLCVMPDSKMTGRMILVNMFIIINKNKIKYNY